MITRQWDDARRTLSGLLAGVAALLVTTTGQAAGTPSAATVEQKRMLVHQLYQRVVAADPSRQQALAPLLEQADAAGKAGELAAAAQHYDDLLRQLASSYRKRDASEEERGRLQRDYDERLTTLSSLESALQAVLVEKQVEGDGMVDLAAREARLAEAKSFAGRGDYQGAIERVDALYEETVALLARLRDNETLEYRLEFASPEEEYQYEMRRFSTHEMLYTMKAAESVLGADKQQRVDRLVERARALAAQAADQAGSGDFEAAIQSQESATSEFVQALRYLGVYLPQ